MTRCEGLEGYRASAAESASCTFRQCAHRGMAEPAHSGSTCSAAACRLPCPHALRSPMPPLPMCHTHHAGYSSSRQSAQVPCCSWAARETPERTALISNHVRVRPKALERRERRCKLRVERDSAVGLRGGAGAVLLDYRLVRCSCARWSWSQPMVLGFIGAFSPSSACVSAVLYGSEIAVSHAVDARVL